MTGISFTPDNHKAIRDLLKTETRRLSGLEKINKVPDDWQLAPRKYRLTGKFVVDAKLFINNKDSGFKVVRPRYHVGETVFIREAWCALKEYDDLAPRDIPEILHDIPDCKSEIWYKTSPPLPAYMGKWRSPLFMPAWAARDFIKILDVKPQRLQEISLADIQAEGIPDDRRTGNAPQQIKKYQILWDSINKKHPWSFNPWLFVYQFKLIKKDGRDLE